MYRAYGDGGYDVCVDCRVICGIARLSYSVWRDHDHTHMLTGRSRSRFDYVIERATVMCSVSWSCFSERGDVVKLDRPLFPHFKRILSDNHNDRSHKQVQFTD
jgi:hypothetical protein